MMPIAIDMFEKEGSIKGDNLEKDKKRAQMLIRLLNVVFYLQAIIWLIVTCITG